MEETLPTLDYAAWAKFIRKKLGPNQRMTRNTLLQEFVAEIERLKADVLAAREKNGISFLEETWNEFSNMQMKGARKQVDRGLRESDENCESLSRVLRC
jgi:kinesin family protein 11